MPWSRPFDFPVPDCETYKAAADYIMRLPAKTQKQPHWQFAGQTLIKAAEIGKGWHLMAYMAMMTAINFGKPEPVKEPRRKVVKKFNLITNEKGRPARS